MHSLFGITFILHLCHQHATQWNRVDGASTEVQVLLSVSERYLPYWNILCICVGQQLGLNLAILGEFWPSEFSDVACSDVTRRAISKQIVRRHSEETSWEQYA